MHRFFLAPDKARGPRFVLEAREAHHAVNVLRLRAQADVSVLDGAGHEYLCRVTGASRKSVELEVTNERFTARDEFQITLIQAIPKGKAWENILQKATELGAYAIQPLITERVVTQFDEHEAESKVEKWKLIAIDAIKQCGNPWLPRIDPPRLLSGLLQATQTFDVALLASLQPNSVHPRGVVREFTARQGKPPRSIALWIGPEGDFTPKETQEVIQHGTHPITLGPRVLRSDTAAIYCLSAIQYELSSRAGG